jgi:hypothetical protein
MKYRLILVPWIAATSALAQNSLPQEAMDLWKASGGQHWSDVKEIRFTFVVESDGKPLVAAKHRWDVLAGTDEVEWKDKHAIADLKNPPQEGDGKAAYARWVNDSYWLLAPLKIRDKGVNVTSEGTKEVDGLACRVLHLSFAQVGLTPTDQYRFYIDPKSNLIRAWDYIPKEGPGFQATWEGYKHFGGLTLATEHHFNGKTVKFTDVEVLTNK